MADAISSTLAFSKIDTCKIFGHLLTKYGDGYFCKSCGKSEQEIKNEQSKEVVYAEKSDDTQRDANKTDYATK